MQTDMHILEMRLCNNMVFDVLLNLIEHGPGIGGKAGMPFLLKLNGPSTAFRIHKMTTQRARKEH